MFNINGKLPRIKNLFSKFEWCVTTVELQRDLYYGQVQLRRAGEEVQPLADIYPPLPNLSGDVNWTSEQAEVSVR